MWLWLGILSAVLLGVYDIAKKWSLRDNAVMPVLFLSTCVGAVLTGGVLLLSAFLPHQMSSVGLYADYPRAAVQGAILLKSALVASSWICAYYSLKHLPISIVAPIRSSSPVWVLAGAVLLFGETLSLWQWAGIAITFVSYYVFSVLGRAEGIHFARNRWMLLVFIALFTGSVSGLYDKYLLQKLMVDPITLQVWFSFYLLAITGVVMLFQLWLYPSTDRFQWRPSIIAIGVLLILSDFIYFKALADPDALISLLSTVRRSSVVVAFVAGGILFREKNKRKKALPLVFLLAGIALLLVKT